MNLKSLTHRLKIPASDKPRPPINSAEFHAVRKAAAKANPKRTQFKQIPRAGGIPARLKLST